MQKYSLPSRILHWLMAFLIISLLGLGIYMADFLSKEAANRMEIYNLHKSLGVIALALIIVRIVNRFINPAPKLPQTIKKQERIIAHIGHIALYILMLIVPLSGYLMSNSYGYPVKLFSINMPHLIQTNYDLGKIFSQTHELGAYALLFLVSLHILGALKHRFFDKPENDVLKRMI